MEKNLKNFITTTINTVDMFEEAKKALLTNNEWMNCAITQISNRLPKKHLTNIQQTPKGEHKEAFNKYYQQYC